MEYGSRMDFSFLCWYGSYFLSFDAARIIDTYVGIGFLSYLKDGSRHKLAGRWNVPGGEVWNFRVNRQKDRKWIVHHKFLSVYSGVKEK